MDLIQRKKTICTLVNKLERSECIEIYKILKKFTNKITENSNGIFINLKEINIDQIIQIEQFINHCIKNKEKNNDYEDTIKKHEKLLYNDKNNKNYVIIKSNKKKDDNTFTFQSYINKLNYNNEKIFHSEINLKNIINENNENINVPCEFDNDNHNVYEHINNNYIDNDYLYDENIKNDDISLDKISLDNSSVQIDNEDNTETCVNNLEINNINKSNLLFKLRQKKKNNTEIVVDELEQDL